jgi:hypothetical protein
LVGVTGTINVNIDYEYILFCAVCDIYFLQLVYKHGLAQHPVMEETIKLMFEAMGEFRLGKSSTLFNKMAKDLGHIVLTNKKDQITRLVRSAAQAVKTFLQNLPTLVMVYNTMYEEPASERDNTAAKAILQKVKKLRDPKFLLRLVGLGMIRKKQMEKSRFPLEFWQ